MVFVMVYIGILSGAVYSARKDSDMVFVIVISHPFGRSSGARGQGYRYDRRFYAAPSGAGHSLGRVTIYLPRYQ